MKRSTCAALLAAVAAILALAAIAATSASAALPEFAPTKDLPTTFTGTGLTLNIEETDGAKYECRSTSITGVITGSKTVEKVVIKFVGVFVKEFPACGFCGQRSNLGEWRTRELKGTIGYISKTAKTVGLLLEPATAPFGECEMHSSLPATILGSVIGKLQNGSKRKEFALGYEQNKGKQSLQHFEAEEVMHNLEVATIPVTRKFGIEGNMTITTEHELELSA